MIVIRDDKWSERPLARVVLKLGTRVDSKRLNLRLLAARLRKMQLSERYEFLDAIPKTSTGKFSKLTLRERFPM
ncbi:hypothetical protein XI07_04185 [Bradyrhizobium sp. CCBAU 11445]|uniref:hypothetical protein n=1 Tax=Bradyrhizobium sp. CCBAU 11445 TaxID=1630896 RepID=UPI00230610C0|nr:hypothetical protein [Bradyrhizobium sp. CCBAU 11445]MDA9481245.1 hypothetical protein [Bradyrhizobium sp. CCBAU 11445]